MRGGNALERLEAIDSALGFLTMRKAAMGTVVAGLRKERRRSDGASLDLFSFSFSFGADPVASSVGMDKAADRAGAEREARWASARCFTGTEACGATEEIGAVRVLVRSEGRARLTALGRRCCVGAGAVALDCLRVALLHRRDQRGWLGRGATTGGRAVAGCWIKLDVTQALDERVDRKLVLGFDFGVRLHSFCLRRARLRDSRLRAAAPSPPGQTRPYPPCPSWIGARVGGAVAVALMALMAEASGDVAGAAVNFGAPNGGQGSTGEGGWRGRQRACA